MKELALALIVLAPCALALLALPPPPTTTRRPRPHCEPRRVRVVVVDAGTSEEASRTRAHRRLRCTGTRCTGIVPRRATPGRNDLGIGHAAAHA